MTTLSAVRATLKLSKSEHAAFLTQLIDDKKVGPYKQKSKSNTRRRFGKLESDYPQLDKELSPFDPSIFLFAHELQEICVRDLPETRGYFGNRPVYFAPSSTAEDGANPNEEDASMNFIKNLSNELRSNNLDDANDEDSEPTSGPIVFQSETLEEMCDNEGWVAPDNCLHASMTTCTILPKNTLLPVQHSNEGTTITTLLSGSVVWVIWPPTRSNLHLMHLSYDQFGDSVKMKLAPSLDGGIILEQAENEALRIPPFCPVMSFARKTSVLATYCTVTVKNYISMLPKLDLLQSWFKTEIDGERKQSEFNAATLKWLDRLLNGETTHETEELDATFKLSDTKDGLLSHLLFNWDHVKDKVAATMGPADAKVVKDIWTTFLINSVGRECRICGKTIRNKQKLMRKHFVDQHWPEEKTTDRVDSMEVTDGTQDDDAEDAAEPVQAMEDMDDEEQDDSDDPMDLEDYGRELLSGVKNW